MKAALRWVLLVAGCGVLWWWARQADWPAIREVVGRMGGWAPLGLVPYFVVYLVDTSAWRMTFAIAPPVGFGRLFRIRWAGEAVNNLVPTGYVGGEAVKVVLLRRHGVSVESAATSAVISKTAQTLAQVLFVAVGAFLFARLAPAEAAVRQAMLGIAVAGGVGVLVLVLVQRRGLSATVLAAADRLRLRSAWIDRRRHRFEELDRQIRAFHAADRHRFWYATAAFLGGWMLDSVEVFVVARLMGVSIGWEQALAIEAFVGVAKIVGLAVPGAVGIQESGVVLLCRLAGLPETFGYAYALWRRGRELLYAGAGWLLLMTERAGWRTVRAESADTETSAGGDEGRSSR